MAARRPKLAFTPERVAAEGHPYSCALEDLSFEAKPSFSVGWRGEPDCLGSENGVDSPQLKLAFRTRDRSGGSKWRERLVSLHTSLSSGL